MFPLLVVWVLLRSSVVFRYNTFASAGSDGTLSIWDHKVKKRLRQYPKYNNAIPSIAFNCNGTKLAVGVSYTWDDGEEGAKAAERPAVFVRNLGDEVKVSDRKCIRKDTHESLAQGLDWALNSLHGRGYAALRQ